MLLKRLLNINQVNNMTVEETYQIAKAIIMSLGGGVVIVGALSSLLGKIWASIILEKERAKYY